MGKGYGGQAHSRSEDVQETRQDEGLRELCDQMR